MVMDLLWEIKQYDWYVPVLDDSKYYHEETVKQNKIIKLIQAEGDVEVLEDVLKHIPTSTGKNIRNEIFKRISLLRVVYKR